MTAPAEPRPAGDGATRRLVLKVDVDTLRGTVEGVPRLLDLFARAGVRATFLFSLGPDRTGRAVVRVFRKGFVKKVLRSSPAASYGIRTMLYGTLLPAPDIGREPAAVSAMRGARDAGHECGVHAWDHVGWHDRAARLSAAEAAVPIGLAHRRFEDVFGVRARVAGAAGWAATAETVAAQEDAGVDVSSDTRGGGPFHAIRPGGTPARVLEIPTTLPTLDELLAWDEFAGPAGPERTVDFYRDALAAGGREVHSLHTEIEGGGKWHALFGRQLAAWKASGVRFETLGEAADAARASGAPIPSRPLRFRFVRGRSLPVATGTD